MSEREYYICIKRLCVPLFKIKLILLDVTLRNDVRGVGEYLSTLGLKRVHISQSPQQPDIPNCS